MQILKPRTKQIVSRFKELEFKGDMYIQSLGSSSSGNTHILCTQNYKILIDCGLGVRDTTEKLLEIGVRIEDIDLCCITHAHTDHWNKSMFKCFFDNNISVYLGLGTARFLRKDKYFDKLTTKTFQVNKENSVESLGELDIFPFPVQHDAPGGCFGYTFEVKDKIITVVTDFGAPQSGVVNNFRDSDVLFIECNWDKEMLAKSGRAEELKTRIRNTHMSNEQLKTLLNHIVIKYKNLKKVILAHISPECNSAEKALEILCESDTVLNGIDIIATHKNEVSEKVII